MVWELNFRVWSLGFGAKGWRAGFRIEDGRNKLHGNWQCLE